MGLYFAVGTGWSSIPSYQSSISSWHLDLYSRRCVCISASERDRRSGSGRFLCRDCRGCNLSADCKHPITIEVAAMRETFHGGTPFAFMNVAMYAQPYIDAVLLRSLLPHRRRLVRGCRTIQGTLYAPPSILASAAFPGLSRVGVESARISRESCEELCASCSGSARSRPSERFNLRRRIHIVYGKRQYKSSG